MKRTGNSLFKESSAFGCCSISDCIINKERKPAGISFFKFPKSKAEMAKMVLWSNKIQHTYARNTFMLQIYVEPLVDHDTP